METLISRQETTTNLFSVLKWHSVKLDTTCTGVVWTRDHCSCTWQFETSFCFLLPNLKLADTTINGHLRKVWARGNFDLSCANFLGYSTTFVLVLFFCLFSFYAYWGLHVLLCLLVQIEWLVLVFCYVCPKRCSSLNCTWQIQWNRLSVCRVYDKVFLLIFATSYCMFWTDTDCRV